MEMSKERLTAFTDAVLAIIMTILVLELNKPEAMTWAAVWDLRESFFAYTVSFFWLGTMWVNMHRAWHNVEKINNELVWNALILLFFSSFFPYTTSLVADNFDNPVAQTMYGVVVLLVTACNIWMYVELKRINNGQTVEDGFSILDGRGMIDVVLKVLGLILTLTVFPSAMMWAVLITAIFIVLPRSI